MERVMITLPGSLLEVVDDTAARLRENRSQFIRQALAERLERLRQKAFDALMAEGYQAMAETSSEIVDAAMPLQAAVEPVWKWD